MPSIAEHTYPRVVWRDRVKKLWNPIHKKALKNLPEERVRLRVIEYLMQVGWSKHRISTEEAIGEIGDTSMRTDIICYSQQFEPRLLVECKAEHISISAKTAEQVGRYNQKVGAPFLLMTNGRSDYWYTIDNGSEQVNKRDSGPDFLSGELETPHYDFEYWKSRGFAGSKASPNLRTWLTELLPAFWFPENISPVRFLNFGEGPTDVDLSHYYYIADISAGRRLALSTVNTAFGGNRMIIILNEQDENRAVLEINLDLLFDNKNGNSSLYSEAGIKVFDCGEMLNFVEHSSVSNIIEQLDEFFATYID